MTTLRTFALAALTLATTGCMHGKVAVSHLEAARIDVDPDIQTVLVIDRSRARGAEHLADVAEGAATGESFHLDVDSAAIALEALEGVLEDGPRFDVVSLGVDGRAVDTSRWDREMTARKVRQLCRRAACDAVVSLDAFDSDLFTSLEREVDAPPTTRDDGQRARPDVDYEATQESNVTATFRLYDGDSGRILDEKRLSTSATASSGEEETPREALADLPYEAAVFDGAARLGARYGRRISPHTVVDVRTVYGNGSASMRAARKAVKRGDLAHAAALWEVESNSADPVLAAKAHYNLAVAAEANGDLGAAMDLAVEAARTSGKRRIARYVGLLEDRADNDARVADQLAYSSQPAS